MLIIGIDPGISGSICFFEDGRIKEVIDMIRFINEGNYSDYLIFSEDRYFDLEWDESNASISSQIDKKHFVTITRPE